VSSTQAQDGADTLLHLLNGDPQAYQRWAESYYEVAVSAKSAPPFSVISR
jgi:hypothetical protein